MSEENYSTKNIDLHRPYVDSIVLTSSKGEPMRREPDLIDVWFDSGAMPYAQVHYPFEHEADFVIGAEVDVHVHLAQRFDGGGADLHADLLALEVFGLLDGGVLGDDDGLMDFVVGIGEHIGLLALVRDGHAGSDDVGLSGFRADAKMPSHAMLRNSLFMPISSAIAAMMSRS